MYTASLEVIPCTKDSSKLFACTTANPFPLIQNNYYVKRFKDNATKHTKVKNKAKMASAV
jgi:hypothetical protein